jgi:predicted O-methyltransferase YrrM
MRLSTILLNWNRDYLLEPVLRSYAATAGTETELFVIDNNSGDQSRAVIAAAKRYLPRLVAIHLDENLGGEAINIALERVGGDLVHLADNDQLFLDGWVEHVMECFRHFPSLGQLCLHGIVLTDDEARGTKTGRLRFANGKILYEADGNVGGASILRAGLFREGGIRIGNIPSAAHSPCKLPDDGALSRDVKRLGYWCAWSDRYHVRNLGHEVEEFERNRAYYAENYAAKPGVRVESWEKRMAETRSLQGLTRRSLAFPEAVLQPELTPGPVGAKPARLWSMFDGLSAQAEALDLLYALVRLTKPDHVVETGTWLGRSAMAMAKGLRDNGGGDLLTIEKNVEVAREAATAIIGSGLERQVTIHVGDSMKAPLDGRRFQFAVFDTQPRLRTAEFLRFYDHLDEGAIVVFHDTVRDSQAADPVAELKAMGLVEGVCFATPRGIFLGRVTKPVRPLPRPLPPAAACVDFFIVGAQKAGTSALQRFLSGHPAVQMASRKEAHHFDDDRIDWLNTGHESLHALFDWAEPGLMRGEATPITMYWPSAMERIRSYNEDARIIVALRHPSFRAFSHWRMEVRRGKETLPFAEAIGDAARQRVAKAPGGVHRDFSYVERGLYAGQIHRILELFPRRRVHVLRTDRLWRQPAETLAEIQAFLGLDHHCLGERSYVSPVDGIDLGELPDGARARLDREFRADILRTADLTGLDLSDWLDDSYREPMQRD